MARKRPPRSPSRAQNAGPGTGRARAGFGSGEGADLAARYAGVEQCRPQRAHIDRMPSAMISPMLRSLGGALLIAGLVVGALLLVGTRPAVGDLHAAPNVAPPTTDPNTSTTSAIATTTTTTTTTTSTTTTTTTTTTTIVDTSTSIPTGTAATPASSAEASNTVVGIGGTIDFDGTCDRPDFGSVVVRITGTTTELVDTGLTGSSWSYRWTAPTDPLLISSFEFEFWCGDPTGAPGVTFPEALRRRVDMVASVPAPTGTPDPSADPGADPAQVILPETG